MMITKFIKHFFMLLFISMLFNSCATVKPAGLKSINLDSDVVIMYSTDWCHVCDNAKNFLNEHNIEYIELDYEDDVEFKRLLTIVHELDYRGILDRIPIFIVRKQILIGYDPETILWILGGEFN